MASLKDDILTYEVREVLGTFHDAERFEAAVEALETQGIRRAAINLIASHDAVRRKLDAHFAPAGSPEAYEAVPQTIFMDRREIRANKRLAVGLPLYIGGAGAGLAVVATGGTLAFAALLGAAGAAVGADFGNLIARSIGTHHAHYLETKLAKGALVVTVEISDAAEEEKVIRILTEAGGDGVEAHTLLRFASFDRMTLESFDPYDLRGV